MLHQYLEGFIDAFSQLGLFGLALMSFAESSFFPIPPDVLLIPMSIKNPQMAYVYGAVTSLFSVLGGIFGYWLGTLFGVKLLYKFAKKERVDQIQGYFKKYGGWAILIAALTPIPYKVFTIAAGVFRVQLMTLIIGSMIGRSARFMAESAIIVWLGPDAQVFIKENFNMLTIAMVLVMALVYIVARLFKKTFKGAGVSQLINRSTAFAHALGRAIPYWVRKTGFVAFSLWMMASMVVVVMAKFIDDYGSGFAFDWDLNGYNAINNFYRGLKHIDPFGIIGSTHLLREGFVVNAVAVAMVFLIVWSFFRVSRKEKRIYALLAGMNIGGSVLLSMIYSLELTRLKPILPRGDGALFGPFSASADLVILAAGFLFFYLDVKFVSSHRTRTKIRRVLMLLLFFTFELFRLKRGYLYLTDGIVSLLSAMVWSYFCVAVYQINHLREHFTKL